MKSSLCILAVLGMAPAALAQTPDHARAEAYVLTAPFGEAPWGRKTIYVSGGGQIFLFKGLGIGAEVGPVITRAETSVSYVYGLGSANLSYHFPRLTDHDKIEPFFTAGYSATFRAGVQNGWNAGAGVNVWVKKNVALRFEVRDYLGRLRIDHVGPQFGVTFR